MDVFFKSIPPDDKVWINVANSEGYPSFCKPCLVII